MYSAPALLANSLSTFVQIYILLLIIRVLLTWFPNLDWYSAPLLWLAQMSDPYLNLFRRLIPPLGGIDISPMLAIFALQLVAQPLLDVLAHSVGSF